MMSLNAGDSHFCVASRSVARTSDCQHGRQLTDPLGEDDFLGFKSIQYEQTCHLHLPYLLQHADNPVDWHPWDHEALAKAKAENKPIFLSIGYAACHWCHVMAHESFEDPETAALMNQHFINIKVDREERPDLDSIYMSRDAGHDRLRRLAHVGLPDTRSATVLRRHLLPPSLVATICLPSKSVLTCPGKCLGERT